MNLILVESGDVFEENGNFKVKLNERQVEHCIKVLKVRIGRKINVGVINGGKGFGEIENIDENKKDILVVLKRPYHLEEPCNEINFTIRIEVLLGIPRPKVFSKILRNVASLGVKRIILVCTTLVEKSYLSSPYLREENIKKSVLKGMEQAKVTSFPNVHIYTSWESFHKYFSLYNLDKFENENDLFYQKHNSDIRNGNRINETEESCEIMSKQKISEEKEINEINQKAIFLLAHPLEYDSEHEIKNNFSLLHLKKVIVDLDEKNNQTKNRKDNLCGITQKMFENEGENNNLNVPIALNVLEKTSIRKKEVSTLVICIGGENGWTDNEISQMKNKFSNFFIFNFGNQVLTCDHAVTFIFGQLSIIFNEENSEKEEHQKSYANEIKDVKTFHVCKRMIVRVVKRYVPIDNNSTEKKNL